MKKKDLKKLIGVYKNCINAVVMDYPGSKFYNPNSGFIRSVEKKISNV